MLVVTKHDPPNSGAPSSPPERTVDSTIMILNRLFSRAVLLVTAVIAFATTASAQITTATIVGKVVGASGEPLGNAQVAVVLPATGEKYGAMTGDDGKFHVPNLKPGGPYEVTVSRIGFKKETKAGIFAALGVNTTVNVALTATAVQLSTAVITADRNALIDKGRTGPSTSVNNELLERLPSIARSLQDFTRLTPQGGQNSFGGTNFRYNNITIDGAATNDVFSFSASAGGISGQGPSGTPGAGARTQPISMDAIQEVQVVLAPYDVKIGNFTGGSVNAVTRSGTNTLSGSVFSFGRNQSLTGKSADSSKTPVPAYSDYNIGGRLGGAIVKDKAFFFVAGEVARRDAPVGYAPGDAGTIIDRATAQQLVDTLKARYNYDGGTGSLSSFNNKTYNLKLFGRLDFNLSDVNKLNIRHNYIDANSDTFERSPFLVKLGGQDFTQYNRTNSTVAELKSTFANGVSNNLLASFAITDDHRSFAGPLFPQLEITGPSGTSIFLGTDREASVFRIGTKVFELTDNVTLYRGNHTITFGSHNEFYGIDYTFMNAYNGRWSYGSLANFYANKPSRIRGQYDLVDDSYANVTGTPQASFKVLWPSAYVQDEIAVSDRFTVTPGIRVDVPILPDKIPVNPLIAATPAFAKYTNTQNTQLYVAPRISFNWDVNGDQTLQVRGGTGVFAGRAPFAWLAYAYENTGLKVGNVDCRPSATSGCAGNSTVVPLVTNGQNLKTLQTGVFEANILDNNFKMPTVHRSSLAADYKLPEGYLLTLEGMYTQVINDVKFTNPGLKDSAVTSTVDGRPVFQGSPVLQRVNPNFSSVFLIGNTNKGYRYSLTAQVRKNWQTGFDASAAYTYGHARDVGNGVRNSPQSNWEYNQVPDVRNPALSNSDFDIRHRVVGTFGYKKNWSPGYATAVSAVFTASSGSPFTYIYSGDANRDGSGNNDPIYVPRDEADARIVPAAGDTRSAHDIWVALDGFIKSQPGLDALRGSIAPRNTGRTPWNQQLDLRILQDIPVVGLARNSVQITLDVINVGAIFGTTWGRQYYVPNEENYNFKLLQVTKTDAATGQAIGYSFAGVPNNTPWQYDNLTSRYQAQMGIRYSF